MFGKKKVFITGKSGQLGSSLCHFIDSENVTGIGREIDITNIDEIITKLDYESPDIIIHTAAHTNVDSCEENSSTAYLTNVIGTQNLVNYCIGKEVLFIYISSTGVYGESKSDRYNEFDDVRPTTIHHKSKYQGEKVVQNHLSKYLILRTGWLYGGDALQEKNFVYKRFVEASNNEVIYSDDTQVGNPTYVVDLIEQIKVLVDNDQLGIYNCVNYALNVSRYDYVKKIVELFDVDCDVKVAPSTMYQRIAPVSKNESAHNYKLDLLNLNVMRPWEESLTQYITRLK